MVVAFLRLDVDRLPVAAERSARAGADDPLTELPG